MIPMVFRCPNTGQRVQTLVAEETMEAAQAADVYETVTCIACRLVHIINVRTGDTLGSPRT